MSTLICSFDGLHDNRVLRCCADFEAHTLHMNTQTEAGETVSVHFTGLLAHWFENMIQDNILFGMDEITVDGFLQQYKDLLGGTISYGFPRLLQYRGTAEAHGMGAHPGVCHRLLPWAVRICTGSGGGNNMTRQEQKAIKELSGIISKNLKVIAREHGFKVVSDCAYKVLGDLLYEVFLSAPPVRRGTAIRAVVSTKPCAIDNVFWDVYEMGEVARNKPFSFHITAAHSPSAHIIKEIELSVPTVDAASLVMNEAFCRFNKIIQEHHSRCNKVSDFKAEILHDTAPSARLNVVLCEIAEGNFHQAVLLAERELENGHYSLFNTVTDDGIKSIYDYVKEFCQKK